MSEFMYTHLTCLWSHTETATAKKVTRKPIKSVQSPAKTTVQPVPPPDKISDDDDGDSDSAHNSGPLRFFVADESLPPPSQREYLQIQTEDAVLTFRYRKVESPVETDQEMLRKIQGRKNRGKEEINFLDVSVDLEMPKGNEIKRLTHEAGYESDKPKVGPVPSAQQRRKHQITYLAFQAKERELELKNQWAENRLVRKQTQSKYGF